MWSTRATPPSHTIPVTNILLELLILTRCMKAYPPPHKYSPRLQIILANSTQIYVPISVVLLQLFLYLFVVCFVLESFQYFDSIFYAKLHFKQHFSHTVKVGIYW